jgi:methyl-accepting chemotaxis protein
VDIGCAGSRSTHRYPNLELRHWFEWPKAKTFERHKMKLASLGRYFYWAVDPFLNLRIGTRLRLAFAGIFLLMVVLAVFANNRLAEAHQQMAHITEGNMQQIARANQMIEAVTKKGTAIRNLLLLTDEESKKSELDDMREADKVYLEAEKELIDLIGRYDASEAEKALLEAIKRSEQTTNGLMAEASEMGVAGKSADALNFLMEKVRPRQTRWVKVLETLAALQAKTSDEYVADAQVSYVKSRNYVWGLVVASLLGGILMAAIVTVSITTPIREAVRLASAAASGDLTARPTMNTRDETGQLLDAMRTMSENFVRVVSDVRHGSEHIATGAAEIASGNTDLSNRTEQQASALEQTAASMEEMRSTLHSTAESASEVRARAQSASVTADKGGVVVSEAVRTMEDITAASKRIADITSVIDGIAFQTNILALNAAVEAARAGEQGRGFAVVATEVRSLAQRSASAAREIKDLIGNSTESVKRGSALVSQAGEVIQDIVVQVKGVATLIGEISHATMEQTAGVDQVGDAITDLDRATQQNAALVEQAAAAASSLSQQAERLLESVKVFKLESAS